MRDFKYIVLGGGPSGLTVAHGLIANGLAAEEILVLEANAEVGGLCRSHIVDDAPLDIGGGHFLDIKHERVIQFLFQFMPKDEWNLFSRVSKIRLHGQLIDHPLESNLWQLSTELQADYLESIAVAGCNSGQEMPLEFSEWITWKLGEKIAAEYMKPYNEKIWNLQLNELGTYWLNKLPNVSFRETLLSCLDRNAKGTLPAHGSFLYPKEFGYGEVWLRMGKALGAQLKIETPVSSIDLTEKVVNGQWRTTEKLITTIPWSNWQTASEIPDDIAACIGELKNASIDVTYNPNTLDSDAHWIYDPNPEVSHHRQLLRANFAPNSRGHWTETNSARISPAPAAGEQRFHNEFAYPVNTVNKPELVRTICTWAQSQDVVPLGRWGRWEHMNSDIAVLEALQLADRLAGVSA